MRLALWDHARRRRLSSIEFLWDSANWLPSPSFLGTRPGCSRTLDERGPGGQQSACSRPARACGPQARPVNAIRLSALPGIHPPANCPQSNGAGRRYVEHSSGRSREIELPSGRKGLGRVAYREMPSAKEGDDLCSGVGLSPMSHTRYPESIGTCRIGQLPRPASVLLAPPAAACRIPVRAGPDLRPHPPAGGHPVSIQPSGTGQRPSALPARAWFVLAVLAEHRRFPRRFAEAPALRGVDTHAAASLTSGGARQPPPGKQPCPRSGRRI